MAFHKHGARKGFNDFPSWSLGKLQNIECVSEGVLTPVKAALVGKHCLVTAEVKLAAAEQHPGGACGGVSKAVVNLGKVTKMSGSPMTWINSPT